MKKLSKSINYRNDRDYCSSTGKYRGAAHSGSDYDYQFIIKQLANVSEGKFYVLLKIKKSKKTLSGLIEKEAIKIDKDGNESVVTRPHKI